MFAKLVLAIRGHLSLCSSPITRARRGSAGFDAAGACFTTSFMHGFAAILAFAVAAITAFGIISARRRCSALTPSGPRSARASWRPARVTASGVSSAGVAIWRLCA